MKAYFLQAQKNWYEAWSHRDFRIKILVALGLNFAIIAALPSFFDYAEHRNGPIMNDWLLSVLPSYNLSVAISLFICISMLLFFFRSLTSPDIFLTFALSYAFLTLSRMTMIYFVPLNPPSHLVTLHDPLSNLLYMGNFKTKDLFFSGHESTICLVGICLVKKIDKILVLVASLILGALILIQHIHYTIDVAFAPLFAFICFWVSKHFILTPEKPMPSGN